MNSDLLYQVALSSIPNIGLVHARILVEYFGNAEAIFKSGVSRLKNIEGIGEIRANSIRSFSAYSQVESELRFIEEFKIKPLFITHQDYPKRLLNCYDSPLLLYFKGNISLNQPKIIAIVGTRTNTDYGKYVTEQLLMELASHQILVVSGLAYGIDAIAHKAALRNNFPTVAVLAHGLDRLYPPGHAELAKSMCQNGGLLTEFRSDTLPDKHNFPTRNRIVAGMSDATIVIETGIKGGSMITASLADSYNRDVFAFPGKTTDPKSSGCNYLIRQNKAVLLNDAQQLLELMGWDEQHKAKPTLQKQFFPELSENEKKIVSLLENHVAVHIDDLNLKSGLSSSTVAAALLNLEIQNIIVTLPGKMYRLQ